MKIVGSQSRGRLVLSHRFVLETLLQKSVAKAGVGVRVIRSKLESFLPIRNRFLGAALRKEYVATVVIRICIIGLQSYRLLVMDHRFVG